MREHIELVYIIQNSAENGIENFLTDYIQRDFAFNIGVPRLYLHFFDSCKLEFRYFTCQSILSWFIYPKTK